MIGSSVLMIGPASAAHRFGATYLELAWVVLGIRPLPLGYKAPLRSRRRNRVQDVQPRRADGVACIGARMHLVLSFAIEGSERGRHRRRAKPQREIRSPRAVAGAGVSLQGAETIDAVGTQSRAWGADLIVTPYFHAVDPDDPAFEASITMATAAADQFGPENVLPAVFVDQNALMPQHRDDLLNRLTRTDFENLYLLVGVDLPSTAPIANDAVLAGIRLVVEVLAKNGIEVLWGATDSTGLLAAAWAPGTSYALGPDTYLRRRRQPTPGARPRGGFTPATTRVFSRELLSELRVADYDVWTAAGRLRCTCAACTTRGPVAGRLGHYVNNHADLTRRLERATDPPRELATMVDTALGQIGSGPSDADARRHLNHWRAQLP